MTRSSLDSVVQAADVARLVFDRLPDTGLVVVDRDLRVLLLLGELYAECDRDAALGRHVSEVMAFAAWETLGPRYRAALTGYPQSFELRFRSRVWSVRMSGIDGSADEDSVAGVMVLVEEVTTRDRAEQQLQASERLQRSVVGVLSEGVVVLRPDGEILQANQAARDILGLRLQPGVRAEQWWAALDARHPDGSAVALASPGAGVVASGRGLRQVAINVRRGDGAQRALRLNYGLLQDAGDQFEGLVISFHDVTEQEETHQRLRSIDSRLRDAHELAALGSWVWNLDDGRLTILQALPGNLGDGLTEIDELLASVPAGDRESIARCVGRLRTGETDDELLQYCHQLPEQRHVETRMRAVRAEDGTLESIFGTTQDVTDRVRGEAELRSAHDYLRAVTDGIAEGMCTLDVNGRLVYVNRVAERMLGWPSEELLGEVFHDMAQFRRADGSEYPIQESLIQRAGRDGVTVHSADESFIRSDGSSISVEYSAAPFETADGFRGTVLLFSDVSDRKRREALVEADLDDLMWIRRINEAIENDRLVLVAQPIIDLPTGATVQHELLIRMVGADGTTIPPGAFLPAAERSGLIREIDRWVVRQGARLSARGHAVQLNISAESLGSADFAMAVERELRDAGAVCSRIVMELTETAVLQDEDAATHFIKRVRALGCGLALDDFGTGYGGFTYLKRLDIDFVKIDMEFVQDLARSAASRHVVSAIVTLAADFGHKTVAEGVEDAETLELLRDLGVDYAQGFHIGRPAPAEQALAATMSRVETTGE